MTKYLTMAKASILINSSLVFVLSELEKGRKKSQIMKDKRIAKLELGELILSEDDVQRISQRFEIA